MNRTTHVHIVHGSASWRAKLAFMIRGIGHHAEIYEDFGELMRVRPTTGVLLIEGNLVVGQPLTCPIMRALRATLALPYIVFDPFEECGRAFDAGRAGASGYVVPDRLEALLPEAILRAGQDTSAIDARRVAIRFATLLQTLTPREYEVVELMSEGMTSKEIGRVLAVSPRTVEIHRSNAMHKLKAGSAVHAARMFIEARNLDLAA